MCQHVYLFVVFFCSLGQYSWRSLLITSTSSFWRLNLVNDFFNCCEDCDLFKLLFCFSIEFIKLVLFELKNSALDGVIKLEKFVSTLGD